MKRALVILMALSVCAGLAPAQKEFLTNDEIDKIREAQEPNLRLKTYLLFARQRLDQLRQQILKDKKGRSLAVRQLLEDYGQIIDAIDTVSDDALKRKVDISVGMTEVAAAEKKFLAQLQLIEDSRPQDLDMYEVSLKNAIDTTSESILTASEDLGKRTTEVTAKAEDATPKRKPPTLYRPGEKPGDVAKP